MKIGEIWVDKKYPSIEVIITEIDSVKDTVCFTFLTSYKALMKIFKNVNMCNYWIENAHRFSRKSFLKILRKKT